MLLSNQEVAKFLDAVFRQICTLCTSPETKFGGEVERRRSGVREGGGCVWETTRNRLLRSSRRTLAILPLPLVD